MTVVLDDDGPPVVTRGCRTRSIELSGCFRLAYPVYPVLRS
jgi:hypothetical protein